MVMPAFGAYAGGLNVRDRAFAEVFGTAPFTAHMSGRGPALRHRGQRCLGDQSYETDQSRRKITEPSQPVASAIIAVARPNSRPCVRAVEVTNCSKPAL